MNVAAKKKKKKNPFENNITHANVLIDFCCVHAHIILI